MWSYYNALQGVHFTTEQPKYYGIFVFYLKFKDFNLINSGYISSSLGDVCSQSMTILPFKMRSISHIMTSFVAYFSLT